MGNRRKGRTGTSPFRDVAETLASPQAESQRSRRGAALGAFLGALFLAALPLQAAVQPPESPPPRKPDVPITREQPAPSGWAQRLLAAVNAFRERQGEVPLRLDPTLTEAAQAHSEAMLAQGCFQHRCAGENDLGGRLEALGYRYRIATENIAAGFEKPEDVVRQWIRSPSHRANMLMQGLTEAGVGIASIPREEDPRELGTYWTLDMAGRRGGPPAGSSARPSGRPQEIPPPPAARPERPAEAAPGPRPTMEPATADDAGAKPAPGYVPPSRVPLTDRPATGPAK